jgi:exonuclease SbcD
VRVVPLAPQVVRVEVPGADAPIVVGLLPFLSEAKVTRDAATEGLGDEDDGTARYAERLGREMASRAAHVDPKAVNVLAAHQYVTGGWSSESERRLRVGALSDVDAAAIPAGLDYVALGHLHRPQTIAGAGSLAVYAGSPIAYSFSEAGQEKRAVLVEARPGRPAVISDVPLRGGRPLEVWAVASIEEAQLRASTTRDREPIVEIRASFGRALGRADGDALFALPGATVLAVRDLFDPRPADAAVRLTDEAEVRVEDLFGELWSRKHGAAPDEETLAELRAALLAVGAPGAEGPGG